MEVIYWFVYGRIFFLLFYVKLGFVFIINLLSSLFYLFFSKIDDNFGKVIKIYFFFYMYVIKDLVFDMSNFYV